jgi:Family of unknown function (DUF6636)
VVLAAGLAVVPVQASRGGFVPFRMPSKNIACAYITGFGPATLRCDIFSGLKPEPRGRCELDWTGLSMGAASAARPTCAGDTVFDPEALVLRYGSVWKRGPFTCLSSYVGLSCANRGGHGFFLSKERWAAG